MHAYYLGNNLQNDKVDILSDMVDYKYLKEIVKKFFWPNGTKREKIINNTEVIMDVVIISEIGQSIS